jgi:phosphate starvation-inducible protein PhoH and related proteins
VTLKHHFQPESNIRLSRLCGPLDAHLRRAEEALGVTVSRRGADFSIDGPPEAAKACRDLLQRIYDQADRPVYEESLELALAETLAQLRQPAQAPGGAGSKPTSAKAQSRPAPKSAPRAASSAAAAEAVPAAEAAKGPAPRAAAERAAAIPQEPAADTPAPPSDAPEPAAGPVIHMRRSELRGRTPNQVAYLRHMLSQDITLGIGPAGTGKTFLAVACAVDALERQSVQRLVLTRPAVEAGERLGFLPGDLAQKVDPYLRPLYDALYDLMGAERVSKAFERGLIEIAPLAFMRGRTLNHAFVILDEAQNTTREQMKMFLTRMGFGSRCVVTGDTSQIDLPPDVPSGLVEAERVLSSVKGIGITRFGAHDVVRHPLVARIVEAYEAAEQRVR